MTKRVSEFGRKWDERTPRGAIKYHMGRVHCGTPDAEVEAEILAAIDKAPNRAQFTPGIIRQCVAYALECHKRNRDLYHYVMKG